MNKIYIFEALLTSILMASGQILFKAGAIELQYTNLLNFVTSTLMNARIISAITLYAVTILLWIHVLKNLPLSVAYPFTGAAYLIIPLLGYIFFNEKITVQAMLGCLLIASGIFLTSFRNG